MEYACSIRYAGLLVNAADCDYSSFKNLGLICPNCRESVFLVAGSCRAEHERKIKEGKSVSVKSCQVSPYFGHRPEKIRAEVEKCELKSASITSLDISRSLASSRNQLLRIFNQRLWSILQLCYKLEDFEAVKKFVQSGFQLALSPSLEQVWENRYQTLIDLLIQVYKQDVPRIHEESGVFLEKLIEKTQDTQIVNEPRLQAILSLWRQSINKQMHLEIYNLAVDCLGQKKHLPILQNLVVLGLYNFVVSSVIAYDNDLPESERIIFFNRLHNQPLALKTETIKLVFQQINTMSLEQFEAFASFVRDDILEAIAFTPWADGFAN